MMVAITGTSASAQRLKKEESPAYYAPMHVERIIPKGGERLRVLFLTNLNPDCSSKGKTIFKLTRRPKFGSVASGEIEDFPGLTAEDYKKCNTDKTTGTAVFYAPDPDFVGTDTFSGTAFYPNGRARKFEIKVSVE
jgi:hypothetical protein